MRYKIARALETIVAAFRLAAFKVVYGPRAIRAPLIGFGSHLSIRIRSGGSIEFGEIISRSNFSVFCDGGKITVGNGAFFNNYCSLNCMHAISIGEDSIFGEGVKIYDHDHAFDDRGLPLKDCFNSQPIVIGRNCWIGSNVVILKGVSICDGATIGAGAIVNRSITQPGVYVTKELARLAKVA